MASPPDATGGPMPLESRGTQQAGAGDVGAGDVDLIGLNDEPPATQEPGEFCYTHHGTWCV